MFPDFLHTVRDPANAAEHSGGSSATELYPEQIMRDADTVLDALDSSAEVLSRPLVSTETLHSLDEQLCAVYGKAVLKTYEAATMFELARVAAHTNVTLALARAARTLVIIEDGLTNVPPHDVDSIHKLYALQAGATTLLTNLKAIRPNEANTKPVLQQAA